MSRKYSSKLSTFKGDPPEQEDGTRKPDYERFEEWVEDGYREGKRREARPIARMVALLVIILCLAWSASRPDGLKRRLLGSEHPRTPIPVGISVGEPPPWTIDNVKAAVESIRPAAQACLQGWQGQTTNDDGMVVAEVVLTPEGPDEAAIYDQVAEVPESVATCVGTAIGSVPWPLPPKTESVPFPIVGGQ